MTEQIRILCVDDERNVLRSLERIFLDDDYEILTANSGEEGLELLDQSAQVQVVISDYRMPGMNGVDFLKEVFGRRPETIRIVLSGYADTAAVVAAINEGKIYKFIPKPWNDDELRLTVAKAIETFEIHRKNLELTRELAQTNEELSEMNARLEYLVEQRTTQLVLQNRALAHAQNVLDHLPVGVMGIATDGMLVQMNQEAAGLLSLTPEQALGEPVARVLPPELIEVVKKVSPDACGFQRAELNGSGILVKGITIVEEGELGVILTVMPDLSLHPGK